MDRAFISLTPPSVTDPVESISSLDSRIKRHWVVLFSSGFSSQLCSSHKRGGRAYIFTGMKTLNNLYIFLLITCTLRIFFFFFCLMLIMLYIFPIQRPAPSWLVSSIGKIASPASQRSRFRIPHKPEFFQAFFPQLQNLRL